MPPRIAGENQEQYVSIYAYLQKRSPATVGWQQPVGRAQRRAGWIRCRIVARPAIDGARHRGTPVQWTLLPSRRLDVRLEGLGNI
jgi:hypothetical protein